MLDEILAGDHRTEAERARDQYRHPKETLLFFGVEPDMNVIEIWPGGGWYTQILSLPIVKAGGGKYTAAGFSSIDASEKVLASIDSFEKTYVSNPAIYGDIAVTVLGKGGEIGPASSADAILTFRNLHNWTENGDAETYFAEFYRALKPGGILGLVDHRADGAELPRDGSEGYLYTEDVIQLAVDAGLEFVEASEINANPNDTKNHPFGVWTLPPSSRYAEIRGEEHSSFDPSAYANIGESDRMTLKFRKPAEPDAALLE